MNRRPTLQEIIIASLFHDIGKFAQRTGKHDFKRSEMEGQLCKKSLNGNFYTHQHVLYTLGVIESLKDTFPKEINTQLIANLSASHHNPSSVYEKIISLADQLSSGNDRIRVYKEEEDKKYYEIPLQNILENISIFPDPNKKKAREYPLAALNPQNIFPSENTKICKNDYASLWTDFYSDIKLCTNLPFEQYLPAINAVFERYLWCIPSSTIDDPDISLYDHSSTTTAFAAVLYRYFEDQGKFETQSDVNENETPFLFVNGDVSGIQRYIFDLKTSEANAKILRARSFDIQCMTEKAIDILLYSFNLPQFCALMNAGGRFLVVLPNVRDARERIKEIKKDIESFFISHYFGEASVLLSQETAITKSQLYQKNISILYNKITASAIHAKKQKFDSVLVNQKSHIVDQDYQEIQEKGIVCPLCEKRAGVINIAEEGESDHYICNLCNEIIKKGEKLPKAVFLARRSSAKMASFESTFLYTEEDPKNRSDETLYRINSYKPGYGFLPMPYHIPREKENGQILTFEQIAEKSQGIKKLAMLKADVDNLGAIFSFGLGTRRSISRYAMLSRILNFFFTNWINATIKNDFSEIYTVFSGGDDLCVIGPWNVILDFALFVRKEFVKLTGNNDSITLSAGISLSSPNLPVRIMAEEAEHLLEQSKTPDGKGQKDNVTVFDTTVRWQDFENLLEKGKWLYQLVTAGLINPSLLYRILKYHEMEKRIKNGNFLPNALWHSHFHYDATRNIEDIDTRNKLKEFVSTNIKEIRIPVSYAIYLNRKKEER